MKPPLAAGRHPTKTKPNPTMSRLYRNLETGEATADYGTALDWATDGNEVGEYHIVTKFGGDE